MPFLIVESYISLNLVGSFAVVTSVVGGSVVRSSAVRASHFCARVHKFTVFAEAIEDCIIDLLERVRGALL